MLMKEPIDVFWSVKQDGDTCIWLDKNQMHEHNIKATTHVHQHYHWSLSPTGPRSISLLLRPVPFDRDRKRGKHIIAMQQQRGKSEYLIELQGIGKARMMDKVLCPEAWLHNDGLIEVKPPPNFSPQANAVTYSQGKNELTTEQICNEILAVSDDTGFFIPPPISHRIAKRLLTYINDQ